MFWEELNVNDFAASVAKCKGVCVFPIGCLEKHGNHLPLGTDIYIARDIAARAAQKAQIDEVHAELLPQDKVGQVEKLMQRKAKHAALVFVGDGVNDAPVLARADVGVVPRRAER